MKTSRLPWNGHTHALSRVTPEPGLKRFTLRRPPPGVPFTPHLRAVLPVLLWVVDKPFRGGCPVCLTMHEIYRPAEYPVLFGEPDENRTYHVCLCMGEFE